MKFLSEYFVNLKIYWAEGKEVRKRYLNRMLSFFPVGSAIMLVLVVFTGAWLWFGVYQPPIFFPVKTIITIPEGVTLGETAHILKEEQVVRSAIAFRLIVSVLKDNEHVMAGDYYFDTTLTLDEVVTRITNGQFGLKPIKITIPEGSTTYQMAVLFDDMFERFDPEVFILLSREKEGYLFPDTYFFLPNISTVEILNTMERTFYERLRILENKISQFGRPVHEVVTMASLLEKEARDYEERRTIAGVLWKRISIDMPLQVDAVFGFIARTETFSPLYSDLDVESEYNTYRNVGLPPGPIGSPSLQALDAAVSPIETDALFYLHGNDGVLRIAQTYDEHLINKRHYLY